MLKDIKNKFIQPSLIDSSDYSQLLTTFNAHKQHTARPKYYTPIQKSFVDIVKAQIRLETLLILLQLHYIDSKLSFFIVGIFNQAMLLRL